jgi:hypothetical protein
MLIKKEKKVGLISFIKGYESFFKTLLSINYPFTLNQIKKHIDMLVIGNLVDTLNDYYRPDNKDQLGLICNNNIYWSNELRSFLINYYKIRQGINAEIDFSTEVGLLKYESFIKSVSQAPISKSKLLSMQAWNIARGNFKRLEDDKNLEFIHPNLEDDYISMGNIKLDYENILYILHKRNDYLIEPFSYLHKNIFVIERSINDYGNFLALNENIWKLFQGIVELYPPKNALQFFLQSFEYKKVSDDWEVLPF